MVNFLTTLKPAKIMMETRQKRGGRWQKVSRYVPTTKLQYDKYMGGVDTMDGYILRMWSKFRSRKWHMGFSDYYFCIALFSTFDIFKVTLVNYVLANVSPESHSYQEFETYALPG